MSVELVGWALTRGGLTPRARLVLLAMCHQAHTRDQGDVPAGTYFGGWGALAVVLDPDHDLAPSGRESAVARAIRELVDTGVVKPVDNPHGNSRRWYEVRP